MLSIDDRQFCKEIGARVRSGGFFNPNDARQLLIIIKKLDDCCEAMKVEFKKYALESEEQYEKKLKAALQ